jgi:Tol biopolymer transport system component/DNA-binding winged helix-turn-helix (wHTH) protein
VIEATQRPDVREARDRRGPTRIDQWVLHPDLGVLRSDTAEVRLNSKTLHVLLVLLDADDKGVSRDALLDQVWGMNYPSDSVISRAIADLRSAFGEKAGEQKYIRTLPKYGYQFVAEHHNIDANESASSRPTTIGHAHKYRFHYVTAAALLIAATLLSQFLETPAPPESLAISLSGQKPLTSAPGLEHQPRIVPGGEWVVYAVMRRDRDDWDLFRVALSDGKSQPVAVTPGVHEHGPAISPLGDELAYVRMSESGCEVVIQSLALGVPEPIASCTRKFPTLVDWSPTENWLAYTAAQRNETDGLRRIYLVDRFTREKRRLTDAISPTGTDFYPRFSPSGKRLAFLRGEPQPDHRATLWVVEVESGEETRLTLLPAQLGGMTWISDSHLMYSYSGAGRMRGLLLNLDSGEERHIESSELVHHDYSISEKLLVAAEIRRDRDLALVTPDGEVKTVAQSTRDDHHGQLSYDEAWVALISRRSGFDELWIAATDGGATRRLTRFDGATVRYPDWHPGGQQILFTVQSNAGEQLYEVDVVSGAAAPIATPFLEMTTPRWMPNGDRWVSGCLDTSGWGICVGHEQATNRVADGYFRPQPLDDGFVAVVDETGVLYRLALSDGFVEEIWDAMPGNGRYGWVLDRERILFLSGGNNSNAGRLLELDTASGRIAEKYTGLMPLTDTNISIGRNSGVILFTRFSDHTLLFGGLKWFCRAFTGIYKNRR